jgi:hypothetical protein
MGAPTGNQNAARAKVWRSAIERALERRKPLRERLKAIDDLADALLDKALTGDLAALQEFGNRMDGKPAQSLHVTSEDGSSDLVDVLKSLAERLPV